MIKLASYVKSKKGQLGIIQSAALTLGIAAVVIAFILQVMGNVNDNFSNASAPEALAVQAGITGVATFTDNIGTIALIVVAVIVIGLLLTLGMRNRR